MARLELRDGQWADLREHITHAVDKRIKSARLKARGAGFDADQAFDWETVLVRAFVRGWSVRDPDGAPIPLGDEDAIDRAPDDVVDAIFEEAATAWLGATVPNSPTPLSSDGSS